MLGIACRRGPLLLSVLQLRPALVEALLARKADPNLSDKSGDLPIHASLRLAGNLVAGQGMWGPLAYTHFPCQKLYS